MRSTGPELLGKRSTHTQGLPNASTDTRLFSVTLIKFCAWCSHKNKTRCLRSDSTLYSLISIPALPHQFQEIGFLPKQQGREGEKEKKIVLGLWPYFSVDEQLMMCGEYIWLSWPLWGKVKNCSFLEAFGILEGLFIHQAINLSTLMKRWKLCFKIVSYI